MSTMKGLADRLKEILGLNREPVGVKFLDEKGRSDLKINTIVKRRPGTVRLSCGQAKVRI